LPIDGDTPPGPDPIETKGFNFSGLTEKGITVWPLGAVDDSKALHWCGIDDNGFCPGGDSIYMTQDDSVVFDLQSLELAMSTTPVDIQLIGLVAGGGIISTTLFVDSVTLTTFNLYSSWSNLEQLIIDPLSGGNIAIAVDNIAVTTAVPVPAAFYLFGSGLGLLGWLRRKA